MKNQSTAAAQTASIGNQDMMTFMPGVSADGGARGDTTIREPITQRGQYEHESRHQSPGAMPHASAADSIDQNMPSGTTEASIGPTEFPNTLLKRDDRQDSMDEDLFNASLDALLKEVNSENYGSTSLANSTSGDNDGTDYDRYGSSGEGMDDEQDDSGDTEEDGTATASGSAHGQSQASKSHIATQFPSSFAMASSMTALSSMTNSSSDTGVVCAQGGRGSASAQTQNNCSGAALHLHHHHGHHALGDGDSKPSTIQPQIFQGHQQMPQHYLGQNYQHLHYQPQTSTQLIPSQFNPVQPQNCNAGGNVMQAPQMFASRPISVAAGGTPGAMSLLSNLNVSCSSAPNAGGVCYPGVAAGTGIGQQQQQNQFVFQPMQTHQRQLPITGHFSGGGTSISNSILHQIPNNSHEHQQGHQSNSNEPQLLQFPIPSPSVASAAMAFGQSLPSSSWAAMTSLGFPSNPPDSAVTSSQPPTPFQPISDMPPQTTVSSNGIASTATSQPPALSSTTAAPIAGGNAPNTTNDSKNNLSSKNIISKSTKRKRPSLAVSEAEDEKTKRRAERNLREQERSHRITERIAELRTVLAEAGVHFKPDRYSTLVSVVEYIKQLQNRSQSLDEEHKKLMATISTTDQIVKCGLRSNTRRDGIRGLGSSAMMQTHLDVGENVSSTSSENNDDEFLLFVQGIDYKFIFSSCGVALAIASVDGRFVDCNEEFLRITNYTRKELLGEPRVVGQRGVPSPSGGLLAVSSSMSSNSTALSTAAVAAAAAQGTKSPGQIHLNQNLSSSVANDVKVSASSAPGAPGEGNLRPPAEIHTRKQHLSLFNLLGREDMETVYAAMSRMLRSPAPTHRPASSKSGDADSGGNVGSSSSAVPRSTSSDSLTRSTEESSSGNDFSGVDGNGVLRYSVDHWSGNVKHTRRKDQMVRLILRNCILVSYCGCSVH
ncbi:hypothetical protein ACHAXS_007919 [Conticribra weissflogii]